MLASIELGCSDQEEGHTTHTHNRSHDREQGPDRKGRQTKVISTSVPKHTSGGDDARNDGQAPTVAGKLRRPSHSVTKTYSKSGRRSNDVGLASAAFCA